MGKALLPVPILSRLFLKCFSSHIFLPPTTRPQQINTSLPCPGSGFLAHPSTFSHDKNVDFLGTKLLKQCQQRNGHFSAAVLGTGQPQNINRNNPERGLDWTWGCRICWSEVKRFNLTIKDESHIHKLEVCSIQHRFLSAGTG